MNKALVAKNLWKLASQSTSLCAQVIQAKYFPRGSVLTTRRRANCTKLWRQLMDLREVIIDHLSWQIGSGESIPAYCQPWFSAWKGFCATTNAQREVKVSEFISQHGREWDFQKLQEHFGFTVALQVSLGENVQPLPSPAKDRLLFTFANNGQFSVKKAYQLIRGTNAQNGKKEFWDWLWNDVTLQPKIKMFIWRCCWKAVPVQSVLAVRIRTITPTCKICNMADETIMHCLFHCNFARAAWMNCQLGIRTDQLPLEFVETVRTVRMNLSDLDFIVFSCTMWAIWRLRNEVIYGGKGRTLTQCKLYTQSALEASQVAFWCGESQGVCKPIPQNLPMQQGMQQQLSPFVCYVDGSWSEGGSAGIGLHLMQRGRTIEWVSQVVYAVNASQAEAKAILEGCRLLVKHTSGIGIVFSDSNENILSINSSPPGMHDWRSAAEIWNIWILKNEYQGEIKTEFCNREDENIEIVHRLANWGRTCNWLRNGNDRPPDVVENVM